MTLKAKLFLLAFGCLSGLGMALILLMILQVPQAGTQFESLEDLRRTMIQRDSRDTKADDSVSLRSIVVPHPSDDIIYELAPNLDVKFQGVSVKTNSCGLRSPEIPLTKSPNTFRIAILGDSFAFGWGVEQDQSFASVIERTLNTYTAGNPKVEVLNFGVPGYSTFQEVASFLEKGLDFDPDAVLLYFIDNDFGLPFFINNYGGNGNMMSSQQFSRLSWTRQDPNIQNRLEKLWKALDPNKWLNHLADISSQRGIKVYATINHRRKWQADYRKLWALRKNKNIKFIPLPKDLQRYFKTKNFPEGSLSLPNDPHPSALKHDILGRFLASYLLGALPEESR